MDIIAGSGVAAVGTQTVAVPAQPQSISRQVRLDTLNCSSTQHWFIVSGLHWCQQGEVLQSTRKAELAAGCQLQ